MRDKVLRKSHNKIIAGVCAGIAEFFGWEAKNVRLIFAIIAIFGGASIIAYLILIIFMPPPDNTNYIF